MARAPASVACPTLLLGLRLGLIRNAGLFGRDNTLNDNRLGRLLQNPTRRALNAELRRQQKELRERGLRG